MPKACVLSAIPKVCVLSATAKPCVLSAIPKPCVFQHHAAPRGRGWTPDPAADLCVLSASAVGSSLQQRARRSGSGAKGNRIYVPEWRSEPRNVGFSPSFGSFMRIQSALFDRFCALGKSHTGQNAQAIKYELFFTPVSAVPMGLEKGEAKTQECAPRSAWLVLGYYLPPLTGLRRQYSANIGPLALTVAIPVVISVIRGGKLRNWPPLLHPILVPGQFP